MSDYFTEVPTLGFVIALIVILFAAWLVTGGPNKVENEGKFIKPAAPLDSGEIYDERLIDPDHPIKSILEN